MKHVLLIANSYQDLESKVTRLADLGWEIVAGTTYFVSLAKAPDQWNPPASATGLAYEHFFSVAMRQREEPKNAK